MCLLNTMCGFFDFVAPKKDKCPKCKVKLVECGEIRYKKKINKIKLKKFLINMTLMKLHVDLALPFL